MVRFLHTADWQVGMTRRYLAPEAQSRFASSRVDAIRRLGEVAEREGCDFVLVCGDVFEHAQLTPQTVRRALEALRAVRVPVYLLPGNHDHLGPLSLWATALMAEELPGHVHVLDTAGVREVAPGVELVAVPWHGKHPDADLVAPVLSDLPEGPAPEGTVRIVAAHGAVDVLDQDRRDAGAIAVAPLVAALDEGRVHYVALGDRHSRTRVDGAVWYSGAPEPTAWREQDPGHVLVVDVEPSASGRAGVEVTSHSVATWRFVALERHVGSDADLEALDAELAGLPDKDRTALRLDLRGTLGLAQHARLEELLARHGDLLGALHRPGQHSDLVVAGDDDLAGLGLGGFLASAVEEIRSTAHEEGTHDGPWAPGLPDDPSSAREALALLYRLAAGGPR